MRRILRIWPLYFSFVAVSAVITAHLTAWTALMSLRLIGLMTFTDNMMAAWLGFNTFAFAPHLWTISYEEQFYAVLPLALGWLVKRSARAKWLAFASVIVTFVGLRALLIYLNAPYPAIYVMPETHFMAILGGILLGLGMLDQVFEQAPQWLLLFGGVAYLGLVIWLPNKEVPGWHLIFTYPGISMTLILYAIMHRKDRFRIGVLENKTVAHLGKISFGLYVYHFFGLNFGYFLAQSAHVGPQAALAYPLVILLSGFVVTLSLAELSYRFLEKPFLTLKLRFTQVASRPV